MEHLSDKTDVIRRYVLGDLGTDELEDVELRLLQDDDYVDELDFVEEELADDFVFGGLSDSEKEKVKKLFLLNPQRRELLQVAHALADYLNELFSIHDATGNGWEELLREAHSNREKLGALSDDDWIGLHLLAWLRSSAKSKSQIVDEFDLDVGRLDSVLDRLIRLGLIKEEGSLLATEDGINLLEQLEIKTEIQFS